MRDENMVMSPRGHYNQFHRPRGAWKEAIYALLITESLSYEIDLHGKWRI